MKKKHVSIVIKNLFVFNVVQFRPMPIKTHMSIVVPIATLMCLSNS